jgi:hypothetical protein
VPQLKPVQPETDFQNSTSTSSAAAEDNNGRTDPRRSPQDPLPPPLPTTEQPPAVALFAARQRFNSWDDNEDHTSVSKYSLTASPNPPGSAIRDVIDASNDERRFDSTMKPVTASGGDQRIASDATSRRPGTDGDMRTAVDASPSLSQKSPSRAAFLTSNKTNPDSTISSPSSSTGSVPSSTLRRPWRYSVDDGSVNGRSESPQSPKAVCPINGA